jgi:hypothetical protein
MSLQETYYMKFDSETERQLFKNKIVASPYYISHYVYEREASGLAQPIQYMMCINIGNFVPGGSRVTGEHTPTPLVYESAEAELDALDDEE